MSNCARPCGSSSVASTALDSTANLLNRYASHALCFRLASAGTLSAPGLPAALAARAENKNGRWHLPFDHYADVEPLLAELRNHGCRLDALEIGKPDLEDVFIHLMRDEPPSPPKVAA